MASSPHASLTRRAWRQLKRHWLLIYAGLAAIYMLAPIAVIAVLSFGSTPQGKLTFAFEGFTLEYWQSAFSIEGLNQALLTSLQLAALTSLIATTIGTLMAIGLVRHRFPGRALTNLLIVLPMATPEIVIAAALLSMFVAYAAPLGLATLLLAHVMFSISFVVIVVRSRLIGLDGHLEEAAADLGASPFTTFRTVTLPLLAPGVGAAAFLAFALSADDFVISDFNSGTAVTFPLYVFGAARRGIPVQVDVLATLLFLAAVAAVGLVIWQQRRADALNTKPAPEPAFAARQPPVAHATRPQLDKPA